MSLFSEEAIDVLIPSQHHRGTTKFIGGGESLGICSNQRLDRLTRGIPHHGKVKRQTSIIVSDKCSVGVVLEQKLNHVD